MTLSEQLSRAEQRLPDCVRLNSPAYFLHPAFAWGTHWQCLPAAHTDSVCLGDTLTVSAWGGRSRARSCPRESSDRKPLSSESLPAQSLQQVWNKCLLRGYMSDRSPFQGNTLLTCSSPTRHKVGTCAQKSTYMHRHPQKTNILIFLPLGCKIQHEEYSQ